MWALTSLHANKASYASERYREAGQRGSKGARRSGDCSAGFSDKKMRVVEGEGNDNRRISRMGGAPIIDGTENASCDAHGTYHHTNASQGLIIQQMPCRDLSYNAIEILPDSFGKIELGRSL